MLGMVLTSVLSWTWVMGETCVVGEVFDCSGKEGTCVVAGTCVLGWNGSGMRRGIDTTCGSDERLDGWTD